MRLPRQRSILPTLLLLAGCLGDSPGAPLTPPAEVALVLSLSGPQAVLADAFDQVDNLTIWLDVPGMEEIRIDQDGITPGQGIDMTIPVPLPEGVDQINGTVELHLRSGSDLIFEAFANVGIHRGEATEVVLQLMPVARSISLSPSSMALEVGEQGQFTATVLFATGDEIPNAPVSWSTNPTSCGILVDGTGTVTASSGGTCDVVARSGEAQASATVTVTAPAAGTIMGTVSAEGDPIPGVTVTVSGPQSQSMATGSMGQFTFSGLPLGTYDVSLSGIPPDYDCLSPSRTVSLSSNGQTVTANFLCDVVRTASISGTVTQGSSPLSGVTVILSGAEGTESMSTNGSGVYSFTGLRSGSYDVQISPPGGASCPTTTRTVSVSPGGSATADFTCDPPAAPQLAYVTNEGSGTVSVIDVGTGSVVNTISVGSNPYEVAFTPDGTKAYVTHTNPSGAVSVIDVASGMVSSTVSVGSNPRGIGVMPDGSRAYVANSGGSPGTIFVIDVGSDMVTGSASVGGPYQPDAVAIHPAGSLVAVTLYALNEVIGIDPSTNMEVASDATGNGPLAMVFTPDGNTLYIANFNSNDVTVGTLGGGVVTVPVGTNPAGVAISPDGSVAYVANYGSSSVSVIDTGSPSVITTISVAFGPHGVAFSPDGSIAYVTHYAGATVTVIDVATHTVIGSIPVGSNPSRVAFKPGM